MGLHWINHMCVLAALCVLINIPVGLLLVLYNQQNGTSTVYKINVLPRQQRTIS